MKKISIAHKLNNQYKKLRTPQNTKMSAWIYLKGDIYNVEQKEIFVKFCFWSKCLLFIYSSNIHPPVYFLNHPQHTTPWRLPLALLFSMIHKTTFYSVWKLMMSLWCRINCTNLMCFEWYLVCFIFKRDVHFNGCARCLNFFVFNSYIFYTSYLIFLSKKIFLILIKSFKWVWLSWCELMVVIHWLSCSAQGVQHHLMILYSHHY